MEMGKFQKTLTIDIKISPKYLSICTEYLSSFIKIINFIRYAKNKKMFSCYESENLEIYTKPKTARIKFIHFIQEKGEFSH